MEQYFQGMLKHDLSMMKKTMPEPRHEVWSENYMLIYGDEDTMFDT